MPLAAFAEEELEAGPVEPNAHTGAWALNASIHREVDIGATSGEPGIYSE